VNDEATYKWADGVDAAVTKLTDELKDEPKYQNCVLIKYTDTEHLEKQYEDGLAKYDFSKNFYSTAVDDERKVADKFIQIVWKKTDKVGWAKTAAV
jgi:hypothetical protein